MVSALTRQRLALYLRIVAMSAAIGAIYGLRVAGMHSPLLSTAIGIANSVLIAGSIAAIEMFGLRSGPARRLTQLPFALLLLLKTLAYGGVAAAVLALGPGERLFGTVPGYTLPEFLRTVGFSLSMTFLFVVVFQVAGLVGYRTFFDLLRGRYRRPRAERRFFLFVDVVGSTALAERLGPLEAHRFLATVFSALAEPVAACAGEIYQYVGDEIVVTWTAEDGARGARPLRCYFAMLEALAARGTEFRARFGVEPGLRAALHLGEVIAGEVGVTRRSIVFHGDVMNTAARLEQATREVGCRFIASEAALAALGPVPGAQLRDLGALALRGRSEPVHAFGVERLAGDPA